MERRVIDRRYPPGSHLVEDEIAEDLGVSRTPVREAFRALQRAGWVEIHPHSGAYVRHATFEEVRDLFELRQWLEERAASVAARRITEPQIRTLERIVERGHKAIERHSNNRVLASLNSRFHEEVAVASGNAMLVQMLTSIAKQVHWYFTAVADQRATASWSEHNAILDAIRQGEADRAGQLMVEHSQRTQDVFVRHLSTHSSTLR